MFRYGLDHLTIGKALQILRGDIAAGIVKEVEEKIASSHNEVLAIATGDSAVYGINTGFGPLCDTIIDEEQTSELQRNILLSHSVGVGKPVARDITKLMLILKVHSLAQGYSGISMNIMRRILWHIENDIVPVVPEQGSVGASGDLCPLSHLFIPLLGEGEVYYKGVKKNTSEVLNEFGMRPVALSPKSGLALVNGTQFILAHAVMVVHKLWSCLNQADVIAAMMIEGLLGSKMPFCEDLHKTRPFRGSRHVAKRIWQLLEDSEIMESHSHCERVQDPYSLRCVPQVHGSSRSAWLHLKETVEVEMNAVTDNPIVFSRNLTVSGGNFHGQPLAMPLDYACLAAAELGNISDRRSYFSLEGRVENTPKLLLKETGVNSGFMVVQYTSAALVSENKGLCFPASADSITTSLGQEDHVSMGSIAGRKALRVCENLENILACELICATQAFDFKRPLRSGKAIEGVHEHIRKYIAHATADRIFAKDIAKAKQIIESQDIIDITKSCTSTEFDGLFEIF